MQPAAVVQPQPVNAAATPGGQRRAAPAISYQLP
jgi:hypothetical protein